MSSPAVLTTTSGSLLLSAFLSWLSNIMISLLFVMEYVMVFEICCLCSLFVQQLDLKNKGCSQCLQMGVATWVAEVDKNLEVTQPYKAMQ
jgi:predicted nucleic acid-binding Zn finger protein